MIAARKYLWVGLTSARSNVAYLNEVISRTIFIGVALFVFLQLWRVTYAETGAQQLGGLTLAQMMWYLAMTEAISLSRGNVTAEIDQDVRTGALAIQLVRPISYPLYRYAVSLGERSVRFLLNAAVGIMIVLVFVGPIPLTLSGLLMFAISIPLAFTLDFLGFLLIGLGAFWLEDTSGISLIYSRLTMILGGMLIPLQLFPDQLQPLLRILPFASIVYGPARLFVSPDTTFLGELLVHQCVTMLIYTIIAVIVYHVAVKRINANGG
jgi:ABC-2 type transport system permease protein